MKIFVARHGQDVDNANGILNGHRDEPLTDLGREQAKDVARKMCKAGIVTLQQQPPPPSSSKEDDDISTVLKAIYSSPLRRAHETAEIFLDILSTASASSSSSSSTIDEKKHIQVEILDDLIERNFGIFTGQPTSIILDKCNPEDVLVTDQINYFLHPTGAETFPELIERAKRLLSQIHEKISMIIETDNGNDLLSSSSSSILLVTHGDFGKMLYAAYYNLHWEEVLKQFHFGNSEVLLLAKDSPPEKAHIFETLQFNT